MLYFLHNQQNLVLDLVLLADHPQGTYLTYVVGGRDHNIHNMPLD